MKQIIYYKTTNGKCPYLDWYNKLDNSIKQRITARMIRLEDGNFGDYKQINNELCELRLKISSGYRIYYTEVNKIIIIFLCAGDKSTQSKDIEKAKLYLTDFKERF